MVFPSLPKAQDELTSVSFSGTCHVFGLQSLFELLSLNGRARARIGAAVSETFRRFFFVKKNLPSHPETFSATQKSRGTENLVTTQKTRFGVTFSGKTFQAFAPIEGCSEYRMDPTMSPSLAFFQLLAQGSLVRIPTMLNISGQGFESRTARLVRACISYKFSCPS